MQRTLLFILISVIILAGCEKIPTGVVDKTDESFHITEIEAPADVNYYNDSSFTTSLRIENPSCLKDIWMDISYSGASVVFNHISLLDDGNLQNGDLQKGDNLFSARVFLSDKNLSGLYRVNYFVNADGEIFPAGVHTFNFINGKLNSAPVISNLQMPDTVSTGEVFVFSVKAFSAAGPADIKRVFFRFVRQDGTTSDLFDMHDDGNAETFGDEASGDGIYSFKNYFSEAAKGQSRKFIFQAVSYNDSLSNTITHNIYIK
ncbi:MAG: hypothetical protein HF308_06600 [Ignavibacteria bacterium]|jgi:hypothetical protein|nr:hypothetical protein [Ignavibacteria bacterium]